MSSLHVDIVTIPGPWKNGQTITLVRNIPVKATKDRWRLSTRVGDVGIFLDALGGCPQITGNSSVIQ